MCTILKTILCIYSRHTAKNDKGFVMDSGHEWHGCNSTVLYERFFKLTANTGNVHPLTTYSRPQQATHNCGPSTLLRFNPTRKVRLGRELEASRAGAPRTWYETIIRLCYVLYVFLLVIPLLIEYVKTRTNNVFSDCPETDPAESGTLAEKSPEPSVSAIRQNKRQKSLGILTMYC